MTEPVYTFRLATPDDAEALQAIYAPYIGTSITFECHVPTVEEFRERIDARYQKYPYIVCEEDGRPVGYAYASHLFTREAYDWAVELSVYFEVGHRGRGLGKRIYGMIIEFLTIQGIRSIHGKVTEPNPHSDKLHQAMGFELIGCMKKVGFKMGMWRNVNHYQKQVGDLSVAPDPITWMVDLDPELIQRVLNS